MMKNSHRCSCGKRRFRDHLQAVRALHNISNRATPGDHIPVRSYACPMCSGWHLTSQP